jgi:hypothetical protein
MMRIVEPGPDRPGCDSTPQSPQSQEAAGRALDQRA